MKNNQEGRDFNSNLQVNQDQLQPPQLVPAVDILETEEMVIVHTEMPGIDKEKVNIDLENNVLTISGSMSLENDGEETFLLKEFEAVKYIRKFSIAESIDEGNIEASMSNGILTVHLPKISPLSPRKIDIGEN